MKSLTFRLSLATAALALAVPAFAQKPGESGGSPAADRGAIARPTIATDSGSRDIAIARPAGSSSFGAVTSPSTSSIAFPSMGLAGSRTALREEAPQRRVPSGSSSSGQAVSRSSPPPSSAPASSGSSGTRSTTPARQGSSGGNHEGGTQAVPNGARPRGDRPTTGNAVTRTTPRPYGHGTYAYDPFGFYYGAPYYFGNYYGRNNDYSPYFYSPYMLGYGYGLGFPWVGDPWYSGDDFWYGGYPYGAGDYTYSQGMQDEDQGALRLKVKPRDAKVYVDGYFVGTVDSMDGAFQKLPLNGGRHRVAVRADGYQPEEFDVLITPNETATFAGDLKKVR